MIAAKAATDAMKEALNAQGQTGMTWLIWAATISLLICGALVARMAEMPEASYIIAQCAGVVGAGLAVYGIIKLTSAMPVRESDDNAD